MGFVDSCGRSIPDLNGRSYAVGKGTHLWGSISPTEPSPENWVDPSGGTQIFHNCLPSGGLFQITTTAVEYRREGEGNLFPLPDGALTITPPGIEPATRRTVMQLKVVADDGVDRRVFEMDANQSVTIVAQNVCVDWMGPAGTVNVQGMGDAQRALLPRTGLVIDSFLGISVSRIETPAGSNSTCLLTKHLFVPQNTQRVIEIPSYAQAVTIFQQPLIGAASVSWTQWVGNPAGISGAIAVAALPFQPGLRKTQLEPIGNASYLQTDLDNTGDRFFSLVFVIRP